MAQRAATRYAKSALAAMPQADVIAPDKARTLAGLFKERVARTPGGCAYREFDTATQKWCDYTWLDMSRLAACWQKALLAQGLKTGDRVAIRLRNSRHWVAFDQAALGLGLVVVPLYVADRGDNVAYVVNHSDTRLVFCENEEQWHELRASAPDCPSLKCVVVLDESWTQTPADESSSIAVPIDRWFADAGVPDDVSTLSSSDFTVLADLDPDSLASIVYTSGTTGRPKGVMLSHHNMLSNAWSGLHSYHVDHSDTFLSFLPLSHTLERTVGYYLPVMGGATVAYARSIPELPDDLVTIKPTTLVSVPRIFERVHAAITAQLQAGSPLKRKIFAAATNIGWHRFLHSQGRAAWHPKLWAWPLFDRLVASKVKKRLGGNLVGAVVGGAALPPAVGELFLSLDIRLLQGYGLTESSPSLTFNSPDENKPSSIGLPMRDVQVKIADNDELLAKGPNIMLGYWKDEAATQAAIDENGWLHTGDCARIDDDGFVYITGRIKDIIVLSNGEKVPPDDMQSAISEDPLFEQVLVIGEGRSFLSALVVIDPQAFVQLGPELGAASSMSLLDAVNDPEFNDLILQRIKNRMHSFPGYARIYQATVLVDPWSVDNGLLTPTLKLKRPQIIEQNQHHIDRMYAGH